MSTESEKIIKKKILDKLKEISSDIKTVENILSKYCNSDIIDLATRNLNIQYDTLYDIISKEK